MTYSRGMSLATALYRSKLSVLTEMITAVDVHGCHVRPRFASEHMDVNSSIALHGDTSGESAAERFSCHEGARVSEQSTRPETMMTVGDSERAATAAKVGMMHRREPWPHRFVSFHTPRGLTSAGTRCPRW
jgi:hypothetical protein